MVDFDRRSLMGAPLAAALGYAALGTRAKADDRPSAPPIQNGPFQPTPESLNRFEAPDWFRDAKLGIWSHWGPQAVPRMGDWYARWMYVPGHPIYDHHINTYGHPTRFGYKDILPLWKAENFDPEGLMTRYAEAGAKYFVSMGVHHDNFDLWNSKHHRWNAVAMGPKRDIVGSWQKAARKRGLRFGVSEHLGASHNWWYPSHSYDQFWPEIGKPYDGADPQYADLYHPAHNEPYIGTGQSWYTTDPAFHRIWFNRIRDLVDSYQPDLLYTDGGIPFGATGRALVAHLYNSSLNRHGNPEAVYCSKDLGSGEFYKDAGIQDVERGVLPGINPLPWQTDTSNGDWFYSDDYTYKTPQQVIAMLIDIVSKNGNMLLNIVQYPDGDLPPESDALLTALSAWMRVNAEAIHGTRPWKIFGEGPTQATHGAFQESGDYTPQDIRFTTKKDALYALTLAQPQGRVSIPSLARTSPHESRVVKKVRLLGSDASLTFRQTDNALEIDLPSTLPTLFASAFEITFSN
ncbi:alpha-L-fucosidase [Parvularcula sp. LCG005]|uniref:alpha-L-fucosidase n=1 Tax=Parvularcula sp. LCG005 TaxID=3078805 RepID=UPI0029438780|nr:alpha-L-fucosidase [Parvularcula sp. LCG005]WOI53019.1 alpha-L-fucosidase [Parvularcula sp. LCG005]